MYGVVNYTFNYYKMTPVDYKATYNNRNLVSYETLSKFIGKDDDEPRIIVIVSKQQPTSQLTGT